jgi:PAS domain S-box-containing protein
VVRNVKKSGEIIHIKVTSSHIEYHGVPVRLIAARDITPEILSKEKLSESEKQLALIFDNTKDAMWLLKVEGENYKIENFNKAFRDITGIKKEFSIGKLVDDVLPKESLQKIKSNYKKVVETGEELNYIIKVAFETGEVTAEVTIIPIKNREGEVIQLLGNAVDITRQQNSRKELLKMNIELRELASHLQNIREDERMNIAREIHDELGQQLTGLKMDLAWMKRKATTEDEIIFDRIESSLKLVDSTINTVRNIATKLRPSIIDDLGINEAVEWHCLEFTNRTGIKVRVESDVRKDDLPEGAPIAIFRIVQETLTNVARHSKATEVKCMLFRIDEEIHLTISDNGIGFKMDAKTKTLGLLGIKERVLMLNGSYKISSEPGKGTLISVCLPVSS